MDWLTTFASAHPVPHALLVLATVAAAGLAIGSIQIRGIGLGIAGVLFAGIAVAHFGQTIDLKLLEFIREFGLVLFVYTIGMQVGPGFVNSLRRQGLPLNLLAAAIVLLGAAVALTVGYLKQIPIAAVAGLFSGATTNTPSLGAAQEALKSVEGITPGQAELPGLAYAVSYPFGIIGILLTMVLLRWVFRINLKQELEILHADQQAGASELMRLNIQIRNRNLDGLSIDNIPGLRELKIALARVKHQGEETVHAAHPGTVLHLNDVVLAVGSKHNLERFRIIAGEPADIDLIEIRSPIGHQTVVVTRENVLGKSLSEIGLDHLYGVAISRVMRSEQELPAGPDLRLEFGDRVRIVGEAENIGKAAKLLGNSIKKLNHTQFVPVFIGILLGVLLGSYPIQLPGIPVPISLGMAGGPLVAALLLSRVGRIGPLVWYMPVSANIALRELGIVLFLACVGLKAGSSFVGILINGDGLLWMGCGALITVLPLIVVGLIARTLLKQNYVAICGLLAGGMTDPPALAFANNITGSDAPALAYSAVYPMTMLLRIVIAQLIVLIF